MTPSRTRALYAISRKRIGVAALSGAQRVTRLGHRHGTARAASLCARNVSWRVKPSIWRLPNRAPSLVDPFSRVSDAWVCCFVLAVTPQATVDGSGPCAPARTAGLPAPRARLTFASKGTFKPFAIRPYKTQDRRLARSARARLCYPKAVETEPRTPRP